MIRVSSVWCFLLMSGTLQGGQAVADETAPGSSPHRVRVTAPSFASKPIVGNLVGINDGTITIRGSGASDVIVPAPTVTRVEISRRASRKRRGAVVGGLVGLGVGAVVGLAAGDDCGGPNAPTLVCIDRGSTALAAGLTGGLVGAVIGALVAPGERWDTVEKKGLRVSLSPLLGRHRTLGVRVTLRF